MSLLRIITYYYVFETGQLADVHLIQAMSGISDPDAKLI